MATLHLTNLDENPFVQFSTWINEAIKHSGLRYPNAACLSTIDQDGYPDGRIVLIKDFSDRGFSFYTNSRSVKGRSLERTPRGALTLFWDILERQVRIQGDIELLSDTEADEYFSTRPREAQIGAWASKQSEFLESREELLRAIDEVGARFSQGECSRPPHWNGYLLRPRAIEFWQEREARLHDRFIYRRIEEEKWGVSRLYP